MRTIPENPPRFAQVPAHEGDLRCVDEWNKLMNGNAFQVVRHGLRFNWIPGMNPVNPHPMCSPRCRYTALALESDPLLEKENSKAVGAGAHKKVSREDVKCTSRMFHIRTLHPYS